MAHSQFDLTYFSPKVEKRLSGIEGRGLFAREAIAAGEVVVVKGGYILTEVLGRTVPHLRHGPLPRWRVV